MDEKLKTFIKKEIIDTNPINLKDALVGALSNVKIKNKDSNRMYTEEFELTLFIVVDGIPKSIDEVHRFTVFAYNQNTGKAYESVNKDVCYSPLIKIDGIYHPYWAFCYGNYEFCLERMLEYQEFLRQVNNDKLSFE